jgi:hypothetical protein
MEIIIDKRIELLAVVQTLDKYWDDLAITFMNRELFQCKYKENLWSYFGKYKNHETVKLYSELSKNIMDICTFLKLMLCYSNPPKLNSIANPENNFHNVFESDFPFEKFISGLRQFYVDTNFELFLENNQNEYVNLLGNYENKNEILKYVSFIDNYLGTETKNYTVIISALLMGCFGINIHANENVICNYSIMSPYDCVDNKYVFGNKNSVKELLWHEIGHLTINDLTRNYISQFNVNEKPVSEDFVKNLYTDIETVINEYIIRAITIRLFEMNHEEKFAEHLLNDNIQKGFKEIEAVKHYMLNYCEKNNELMKDEMYKELMNYVIGRISSLSEGA